MTINGNVILKKEMKDMGFGDTNNENRKSRMAPIVNLKEPVSQQGSKASKKEKKQKVQKVIQIPISGVISSAVAIIGIFVPIFLYINSELNNITKTTTILEENVKQINENISKISNDSLKMYEYLYYDGGVKTQLGKINEALNIKVVNVPDDSAYSPIKRTVGEVSMPESTAPSTTAPTSTITADSPIGLYEDGNPCYAKDVINEPILLTYTEGTKEIYFYGALNERYQWNGYCVTNVYSQDGLLTGICESNFENGKRLDYKSLYQDAGEWIYSDKECEDDGNIGINISYSFNYNSIKNFTSTNVRITDILYADKFLESVSSRMLKYYSGKTLDGKYNDDSGHAYEVSYDDEGYVKVLYVGKFSGGAFNDDTGRAWDIAYAEDYSFYVRNTGNFKDNNAVVKSKDPISIEEIQNIISGYDFGCELKWKQD